MALLALGIWASDTRAQTASGGADRDGAVTEERVVLITGSTDGLGRAVALQLAGPGTHIIVHGRNRERGEQVVRAIEDAGGTARFFAADFASLRQTRAFAEQILAAYDRLDVLVNNAGIWLDPAVGRQLSEDGHELHFAVNHLAGFVLTRMLLPLIVDSAPSQIVNVASLAQSPVDFGNVMLERGYSDARGYGQSKLAQVLFTFELAERLRDTGVRVNALHPATMMDTNMVLSRGAATRSSVAEGAEAVLHLIESPEVGTGEFYSGTRPSRAHDQAYDPEVRTRLWEVSEALTAER